MKRSNLSDYGMIFVLLGLCVLFSLLTISDQTNKGKAAVQEISNSLQKKLPEGSVALVVGAQNTDSEIFANSLSAEIAETVEHRLVVGTPRDLRIALETLAEENKTLGGIATSGIPATWPVVESIPEKYPAFKDFQLLSPQSKVWPTFLKAANILAIIDGIVVIAVIAIGMTLVIITAGIDLSVGSLIAFSAVIAALVVVAMGGQEASAGAVFLGFLVCILACGLVGGFTGSLVANFAMPSFIVTLGIMMIAKGTAFTLTNGNSINDLPDAFTWLGRGRFVGIPNTVILLIVLYMSAHLFMSKTRMGRYIYAIGGNREAARLSGVPVRLVTTLVFVICSIMAGIGGCIQASQIGSGDPKIGVMKELDVIAAVVVGGTSLSGGSGRIFGTLIGAFIIGVIRNGMNIMNITAFVQMIVLGSVIIMAVFIDQVRRKGGIRNLIHFH